MSVCNQYAISHANEDDERNVDPLTQSRSLNSIDFKVELEGYVNDLFSAKSRMWNEGSQKMK